MKEKKCKDCREIFNQRVPMQARCFDCQIIRNREKERLRHKKLKDNPNRKGICVFCNNGFEYRDAYKKRKYCNRKCFELHQKEKRKGKGNPAYRDGYRSDFIKISKEMHSEIKLCEICGRNGHMDLHHIIYRSEAPRHKNIHNKRNLIMCCRSCHNALHRSSREARSKLILQRELWELFPELKYLSK